MNYRKILFVLLAIVASVTAHAETIDLGVMELYKDYPLADFKGYKGTFTAPRTGVVTCYSTTTDDMQPFSDEACTKSIHVTSNGQYGAHSYDFNVEEGVTYYMYTDFIMNSNTTFRMEMDEVMEIKLVGSSPAIGGEYHVSNNAQVSFDFSKAVTFISASLTFADKAYRLSGQVSGTSIFFNDVKEKIWNAMTDGTLNPGDDMTITVKGISMASNHDVMYDGTGTLEAKFKVGRMPILLESTENTSGDFLSYYTTANADGIVRLNFSGKLGADKMVALLRYGDIDKDAEGGYYVEYLTPTLSDDGKSILVNMQGKRRRSIDMVSTGTTYDNIALGITGVTDEYGNYAYAEGSGNLGSYWFTYNFKEVTSNVSCEFTPASGSDLKANAKSIEVWVADEKSLTYDGIEFSYDINGNHLTTLVTDITKEQDTEDATAMILTVPLPDGITDAKNIEVSFKNLQSIDGTDYSSILRAKYNAFVITRTNPVAGSTLEFLNNGQQLKIYTNKTASIDELTVVLHDLNPQEGDRETIFYTIAKKSADGKYFYVTFSRNYRLEAGHEYRLDVEAKGIGTDYIIYKGAAAVFRYSDILLESVTPSPETTTLSQDKDYRMRLTYDGLVKVTVTTEAGEELTAKAQNPDEDGFATTWGIIITKDAIKNAGEWLRLHVVATDINGNRVQGDSDYKDYCYQLLTFHTDIDDAITTINAPALTTATRYNAAGQRVKANTKGIIIQNGRKYLEK